MNKKTLQSLKLEEERNQEIKDSWKHIKDLEAELDFLYLREPSEIKYIKSVKNELDKLYEKVNTLKDEIN